MYVIDSSLRPTSPLSIRANDMTAQSRKFTRRKILAGSSASNLDAISAHLAKYWIGTSSGSISSATWMTSSYAAAPKPAARRKAMLAAAKPVWKEKEKEPLSVEHRFAMFREQLQWMPSYLAIEVRRYHADGGPACIRLQ